jgi:excisionase family DNA binding protein
MLSTSEAARRLEVSDHRVRALIAAGALNAERFAGRWAVDEQSLAMLAARTRKTGHRPMAARVAWGAAALADGESCAWLTSSERSRLKRLMETGAGFDAWLARLARRASNTLGFRVHDQNLEKFVEDRRVKSSWHSSSHMIGDRLFGGLELSNVWVSEKDVSALTTQYGLLRSTQPNLRIRVSSPEILGAFESRSQVFRLIAAADLWDEGDSRSQQAARQSMESIGVLRPHLPHRPNT